jgi:hypothetical protein
MFLAELHAKYLFQLHHPAMFFLAMLVEDADLSEKFRQSFLMHRILQPGVLPQHLQALQKAPRP